MLAGQHLVETLDPRPLDPAELIHGPALWSGLAETHVVHLANNLQTRIRVERKARLMKKPIGTGSSRLAGGI